MEWVFWLTALCSLIVAVLFFILYGWSDVKCMWPPCISELIEVHKTLITLFFGFSCAMIWFNLALVSLLKQSEDMAMLCCVIYFAFMGILSFNVSEHRAIHCAFVGLYIVSSCWYVNLAVSPENLEATVAVNVLSVSFVVVALVRFSQSKITTTFKYTFTLVECLWVASVYCYTLIISCENRKNFNLLMWNRTAIIRS